MSAGPLLPLRDIHLPLEPGWWPPAPGWWLLAALALLVAGVVIGLLWRRIRRRRRLARMFDQRLAAAATGPAQIAAMSELLRRASRGHDPAAAALQGDAWLEFLDRDAGTPVFTGGLGRLLLEGGYRREVDEADLDALRAAARRRFLRLAGGRR